jgi:uncharacterized protein YkwD
MMRLLAMFAVLSLLICGCNSDPVSLDIGKDISRSEIMFAHNKERSSHGLDNLQTDELMQSHAQKWADWMALNNSLTHSRLVIAGTEYFTMGENIAMGYDDIDSVLHGWMNSPGHRRNILNPKFTHAGFGYAKRPNGSAYWCAQFGGK